MDMMVYIVLLGWVPLTLVLFATLPARRAVLVSFIAGVLFMPVGGIKFPGIPDYSRATALSILTLLAVVAFDFERLARFRFRLIDIGMIGFCLSAAMASLTNDLGVYDAISSGVHETLVWGVPYFIGRLYFDDLQGIRELAMATAIGALIYIPLCLIEVRFSPQLHYWVYGYYQHQFAQTFRFGGFRPVVFMEHGLAVGLWMAIGTVILVWYWATGAVRRLFAMPIALLVLAQIGTFVLCRSLGALVLATLGLGAMFASKWIRTRIPVALLAVIPLLYITDRVSGINMLKESVALVEPLSTERAESFGARLDNESLLVDRAMEQPLLGWAGWGRSRVLDEEGRDSAVTDGLWVITFGTCGIVGLASLLIWQLGPPLLVLRRIRPQALGAAEVAAPLALSVSLMIVAMDALPNAPSTPVYTMISGGLASLSVALRPQAIARRVRSKQVVPPLPTRATGTPA
jgi:hypothetical protein